MITRSLGSVFRGKATKAQIFLACFLGGALGFLPGFFLPGDVGGGFLLSPGLILAFFVVVMILNANLAAFGLATLVAKLVSLPLLGVSYTVGTWLLDGPAQGLFRSLINMPVFAWFGLENYATTGGLCLGTVFGLVLGVVAVKSVSTFRARMATVQDGSEAYKKYTARRSVRLLTWVFFGGKAKQSYAELARQKAVGNPVRILGVVAAVLLVAAVWATVTFFSAPILTPTLRDGLEQANGATVNLDRAAVDLGAGKISLANLAMADANELTRDLFQAANLEAAIDTRELLRKRMVVDKVVSSGARSGGTRPSPAKRVAKEPPPPPPPPEPGAKTLDDYLKQAEVWRERLAQAQEWLDVLSGDGEAVSEPTPEAAQERRDAELRQFGPAHVTAHHLIEGAPALLVRLVSLEKLSATALPGDLLDLRAENVSTNPRLVQEPVKFGLQSQSDKVMARVQLGRAAQGGSRLAFHYRGLATDTIASQLKVAGAPPLRGGTIDVEADGALRRDAKAGWILDLPLKVTLNDTMLAIAGTRETPVQKLVLPIAVRGPLTAPRVVFEDKALVDALIAAGRKELADQVNQRAQELLKGKVPAGLGEAAGKLIEGTSRPSEVLDEAKRKAEEEKKKAEEAARKKLEEEAKKRLQGLFPPKKDGGE